MPELPDLEAFSKNLDKQLAGKAVQQVARSKGGKTKATAAILNKVLVGQHIAHVYREGKELRFAFKSGIVLGMHLMLHGLLHLFEGDDVPKYTVFQLRFSDGSGLALTDFQGMAAATLDPPKSDVPDALSKQLNAAYLTEQLGRTRSTIKKVLLDQHIIRGIGNAYADEILWEARISPLSISNKIPAAKIKALAATIPKVLKRAIKQIHREKPGIISGELRDFLLIHNPHKKASPGRAAIQQVSIGGRKTYYTEEQELFK